MNRWYGSMGFVLVTTLCLWVAPAWASEFGDGARMASEALSAEAAATGNPDTAQAAGVLDAAARMDDAGAIPPAVSEALTDPNPSPEENASVDAVIGTAAEVASLPVEAQKVVLDAISANASALQTTITAGTEGIPADAAGAASKLQELFKTMANDVMAKAPQGTTQEALRCLGTLERGTVSATVLSTGGEWGAYFAEAWISGGPGTLAALSTEGGLPAGITSEMAAAMQTGLAAAHGGFIAGGGEFAAHAAGGWGEHTMTTAGGMTMTEAMLVEGATMDSSFHELDSALKGDTVGGTGTHTTAHICLLPPPQVCP